MAESEQPGEIITPGSQSTPPEPEPAEAVQPQQPQPQAQPVDSVSWTASEFVAHEKSAGWYATLLLVALIIAASIAWITKDAVSTAVILFGSLVFGIYASRKPRQLPYVVDLRGIQVGDKHFGYEEFRSFSVLAEGSFPSIVFMPLKRFSPILSVYYAPGDEEKILSILSAALPYEEHRQDAVDRLMQRIRF